MTEALDILFSLLVITSIIFAITAYLKITTYIHEQIETKEQISLKKFMKPILWLIVAEMILIGINTFIIDNNAFDVWLRMILLSIFLSAVVRLASILPRMIIIALVGIIIGGFSNALVMLLNGYSMPVLLPYPDYPILSNQHHVINETTRLKFLADINTVRIDEYWRCFNTIQLIRSPFRNKKS
ncbi:MAG: DUF5317 family protein [Parcubacteria group bacterium]|nr:DUF5317 family protein [Parcubacteria group bacterium]